MSSTLDVKMNLGAVSEHSRTAGDALSSAAYRHSHDVDVARNETLHRQNSVVQVAGQQNAGLKRAGSDEPERLAPRKNRGPQGDQNTELSGGNEQMELTYTLKQGDVQLQNSRGNFSGQSMDFTA